MWETVAEKKKGLNGGRKPPAATPKVNSNMLGGEKKLQKPKLFFSIFELCILEIPTY